MKGGAPEAAGGASGVGKTTVVIAALFTLVFSVMGPVRKTGPITAVVPGLERAVVDGEVLHAALRGRAFVVGVAAVGHLPTPGAGGLGDEGRVGRGVGAVPGDVHRLGVGGRLRAGGVARAVQVEDDRAARIVGQPTDGRVVVGNQVRDGAYRGLVFVDDQDLALAGAGGPVVVGVAAVDGLPVEGPRVVEGDRVGVGHVAVGDGLGAGILRVVGAGVIAVDGVFHRATRVSGRTSQRRRVVHCGADVHIGGGQCRRDRGGGLVHDQMLARALTGGAVVVGVAAVDGLPVEGPRVVEGDRVGVGHVAVGDGLGAGILRVVGAGVIAVDGVFHRATRVSGRTSQRRRVVHCGADVHIGGGQCRRDRGGGLVHDQMLARALTGGAVVVGVTAVDGVFHRATRVSGRTSQRRRVVHRCADGHRLGRQLRGDGRFQIDVVGVGAGSAV